MHVCDARLCNHSITSKHNAPEIHDVSIPYHKSLQMQPYVPAVQKTGHCCTQVSLHTIRRLGTKTGPVSSLQPRKHLATAMYEKTAVKEPTNEQTHPV
jgi:hypothetical protein